MDRRDISSIISAASDSVKKGKAHCHFHLHFHSLVEVEVVVDFKVGGLIRFGGSSPASEMIRPIQKVLSSLIVTCAALTGCGDSQAPSPAPTLPNLESPTPHPPNSLTFTKDIAPLVFKHCARCHRPGEAGPFSLLTYEDVRKRAAQIVRVTQDRFMPPWLPEPGYGRFAGERRLNDRQIAMLAQWVEEGAVEGDPAHLPPAPQFPEGWQLGEPDLVVTMPEPYALPAGGPDVFRYFVAPIPVKGRRYVRAFEFRVDNPRILHHASVGVDPTSTSRRLDEEETEPGFSDKDLASNLADPTGQWLSWTPGKQPYMGSEDVAWVLQPNTDAVFVMHMLPSGKPERVQAKVGLFFSEKKPTHVPALLRIGSQTIDISAAEKNYRNHDRYVLPVDLRVLSVYTHAHYLCKTMKGYATLPDGTRKWLIHIKRWDFNWQDEYRYAEPLFLPKGTTIEMEYTYDNSASNLRNPNHPPQRVVYGPNSWDEMGDLWLQVLTTSEEDRDLFEKDHGRKQFLDSIAMYEQILRHNPESFKGHLGLGNAMHAQGRFDKATAHIRHAIRVKPDSAMAHYNLGIVLGSMNKPEEAADQYREAIRMRPTLSDAHNNLGVLLLRSQQLDEAIRYFQQALKVDPDFTGARGNLGIALLARGRFEEGVAQFQQMLETEPDSVLGHLRLGMALQTQGRVEEAIRHYRRALRIEPHSEHSGSLHYTLGTAFKGLGRPRDAIRHLEEAMRLKEGWYAPNALAWVLATEADNALRNPRRAVELAQRAAQLTQHADPDVLDTLAAAYAANRQFDQALSTAERALKGTREDPALVRQLELRIQLYKQRQPFREGTATATAAGQKWFH